jgi:iron(III) transport system substrate-binding protein
MKKQISRRSVVQGIGLGTMGLMTGGLAGIPVAGAQDRFAPLEPLAKAAAKEGPVVWYETTAAELMQPCIAVFNKRYPNVKIEHVRAIGTGDMVAKVIQESRAPDQGGDMVSTTADQTWGISSRGLALDVNWTDYGVPANFVPEKFAIICSHSLFCVIHNTSQVSEADAPKTWDDLTHPRWKGKFGSPAFSHPYAGLVPVMGEARVDEFMKKLMLNEPSLTKSTYTLAQQCASGELLAAVGLNWTALPTIQKGGPIKIVYPDPYPLSTNYSLITKYSKNVNGAKLFAIWLATDEGNQAYEKATGRGNFFLNTEIAKVKLPRASEYAIRDVPELAKMIEKYNTMLRRGGAPN